MHYLYYAGQDVKTNEFLIEQQMENQELEREEQELIRERNYERLRKMTFYCFTSECLRDYILRYFGEYGKNLLWELQELFHRIAGCGCDREGKSNLKSGGFQRAEIWRSGCSRCSTRVRQCKSTAIPAFGKSILRSAER